MEERLNAEEIRLSLDCTASKNAAIMQTRKILAEKIAELRMVDLDKASESRRAEILACLEWYEDTFADLYRMTRYWHD